MCPSVNDWYSTLQTCPLWPYYVILYILFFLSVFSEWSVEFTQGVIHPSSHLLILWLFELDICISIYQNTKVMLSLGYIDPGIHVWPCLRQDAKGSLTWELVCHIPQTGILWKREWWNTPFSSLTPTLPTSSAVLNNGEKEVGKVWLTVDWML